MAKKKNGEKSAKKKKKKKKTSGLAWLFSLAILVIFILVMQLQEKEKHIEMMTKQTRSGAAQNGVQGNQAKPGSMLDKEKVKATADAALAKLIGKAPSAGSSWFLDGVTFLKNDCITITYEDGHTFGSITYKVADASNSDTWVKQ